MKQGDQLVSDVNALPQQRSKWCSPVNLMKWLPRLTRNGEHGAGVESSFPGALPAVPLSDSQQGIILL